VFKELGNAYAVLSDAASRREYDLQQSMGGLFM
jgi:DnaJ-class molecular chaperone